MKELVCGNCRVVFSPKDEEQVHALKANACKVCKVGKLENGAVEVEPEPVIDPIDPAQ